MKMQAFNPFLPAWEYVPDGEPHVFGDRVYVYGSHDKFNAPIFCVNDYVCWSAPVDDLSDWRYEGVIFKKNQDSKNKLGLRLLFAPDVCRGPDGRYYLYYAFDFMGVMGVAVCDTPAGQYQFLGHVHYKDGTVWGRRKGDQFPFDPGVLADDDGRIWLYSGFCTPTPAIVTGFKRYEARIACNLRSKDGVGRYDGSSPRTRLEAHPYFTQTGKDREDNGDQYIANMRDGAVAGFKYFSIDKLSSVTVELKGRAEGKFLVSDSPDFKTAAAQIPVSLRSDSYSEFQAPCSLPSGTIALYFMMSGSGYVDFRAFELQ